MLSHSKINFNSSLKKRNLGSKNAHGTHSTNVLIPLEPTQHFAGQSQRANLMWKDKPPHNEFMASQPSSEVQDNLNQGECSFRTPSKKASNSGLQGLDAQVAFNIDGREPGAELPTDAVAMYLQQCTHSMRIVGESDVVEEQNNEYVQMPVIQIFLNPQLFQPRFFAASVQKALSSDKPYLLSQLSSRCNFDLLLNAEIGCQVLKYAHNQVIFKTQQKMTDAFIVLAGKVKLSLRPQEQRLPILLLEPGDTLAEESIVASEDAHQKGLNTPNYVDSPTGSSTRM